MTDLLIRDPNDTGEIPLVLDQPTRNLAPYTEGLPPAFRRPTVALPVVDRGCRTIDPDDDDFVRPGQPAPRPDDTAPEPLPTPMPRPEPAQKPASRAYVGRHRTPARPSALARAWARIWGAM